MMTLAALCVVIACSRLVEPGTPPTDRSPLFDGFNSFSTLDDVKASLPDRSEWTIISDSKIAARGDCPRFDELMFQVRATHQGHKGVLRLTFINERLESTAFVPQDFASYLESVRQSGLPLQPDRRTTIPPHTVVWQFDREPRFVAWADQRFQEQTRAWVYACS
jgi:hypothetical protein